MALPKLEIPKFELVVPSTNKKVSYRPFLVKEHKVLMMLEGAESEEVSRIVKELIDVCTFNQLKIEELTDFDIEYIFLNLRAKSIGELVDLIITCECGQEYPTKANLNDVKIEKTEGHTNKIDLGNIGIEMNYPKFDHAVNIFDNPSQEIILKMIVECMKGVYTDDEYFDAKDSTYEEKLEFIENLTKDQFEKLEEFFKTTPKVVQNVEDTCPKCNTVNTRKIVGLENFFV